MINSKGELPFISVVIPAYNEEKYLPRCLEALSKQSYPKDLYDVTVVDNNSKDMTIHVAKEYGYNVLSETKQGYVFAISLGMGLAKGDIIAVTDSDTKVKSNWLESIANAFTDPTVVAVGGSLWDSHSSTIDTLSRVLFDLFMSITWIIGKPNLCGFNFAVRRNMYEKVGGINTAFRMSPDVDLGYRLKKHGKVIFNKDMLVMTSTRRWKSGALSTLKEYGTGYIYTLWLRKPPPVKQTVIR